MIGRKVIMNADTLTKIKKIFRNNCDILKYIKQTEAICIEAIKNKKDALMYVYHKTEAILAAVK
jgi:hypothetical protein